jgi:hypothetical protein
VRQALATSTRQPDMINTTTSGDASTLAVASETTAAP